MDMTNPRGVHIGKVGVVFGVLGHPLRRDHLDRFHGLLQALFVVHRAEEAAHIGL